MAFTPFDGKEEKFNYSGNGRANFDVLSVIIRSDIRLPFST